MATPDLTRLLTGFQGSLVLNPSDLTAPPAYGGTPLGEVMDLVVTPRRRTRELHGEEFGPDETIEVVDSGEGWKFTAALRGVDPDLYGLVMSTPSVAGVPSGRPLGFYPGAQVQAGAFLTQRPGFPAAVLLVPKDKTRLPSFLFYAVIPVLDASARLTLQLDREGAFGAVFYCLRNPTTQQLLQWGMLEDLSTAGIAPAPVPPVPGPTFGAFVVQIASGTIPSGTFGSTYTNQGAGAEVDLVLPALGVNGNALTFLVEAAQELRIYAPPGQTIQVGGTLSAPGGYVESSIVGSTITLERTSLTTWVKVLSSGAWNVDL